MIKQGINKRLSQLKKKICLFWGDKYLAFTCVKTPSNSYIPVSADLKYICTWN